MHLEIIFKNFLESNEKIVQVYLLLKKTERRWLKDSYD